MTGHDMIWDFTQPPDNDNDNDKRKKPDRGRPKVPNYHRPLYEWSNQFSVPRPPPGKGRPHSMPQPIGLAPSNATYLSIKPILMQLPKPFKGAHDDIKHFIGDCITYFEASMAATLIHKLVFRYPIWPEFVAMLTSQFRDPAIKIIHKRKMFKVHMGQNPASQFFYKLEKEAKLAGRQSDEGERGTLIAAV
ncbi:uncharacterized protein ARMOST_19918 [Armillaria ostoyae]|uniref:Retrotransposon gag domain-containing protein n=1 Tax=Armillaria ostoyae TaxID=47428 RepID=A0A284S5V8_ARMOS|nr:uncharacterized protein ARMOST_19918 [Armillaria ostoyae]